MAKPGYKSKRRTLSRQESAGRSSPKRSLEKHQKTPQKPSKPRNEKFQNTARAEPLAPRRKRDGERLREHTGRVLETVPDEDYALIDSGNGRKLERYGPYVIDRPEAQAIWLPTLNKSEWQKADAIFTGDLEEEGAGRWH